MEPDTGSDNVNKRRSGSDRRSESDRREAERRREELSFEGSDQRDGTERRSGDDRRQVETDARPDHRWLSGRVVRQVSRGGRITELPQLASC